MILVNNAFQYCNDVISGKEITTDDVVSQCKIFMEDYNTRQYDESFEFYFDESKLLKIEKLIKLFNYATGFLAGTPVIDGLAGFQCLLLVAFFGWRFKENPNKFRYRDLVLFIPRKNAKTFIVALILILLMLTEQNYSEFYSICVDRDLAKETRKAMAQLISASPALKKHFFISESEIGQIRCRLNNNYYVPRTSKANKNNSIRPAAYVADEIGAFTTTDNIQAMRKGQLSVPNPLTLKTTTAYAESDSIMLGELEYDRAVLNGVIDNPRMFCLLYYANDKDECWTETGLLRANPLRIEQNYAEIRNDRDRAKTVVNEQEELYTKNFNIFLETNELNKYMNIKSWKKGKITLAEFKEKIKGQKVQVGIDLSVTTDLTAVSIEFTLDEVWYCHTMAFLPKETLEDRREKHINYYEYEQLGYCQIHDGMTISYEKVEQYVRNIETEFDCTIEFIVTDPMNAKEMVSRLECNYNVLLLKQTYTNLSPATKDFRHQVYNGNVRYAENELLDWCMNCASTSKGKSDDEMLMKENKNKQRIDPVAALINCHTQYVEETDSTELTEESINSWFSNFKE